MSRPNDTRPIIGFDNKIGKRYDWDEFDTIMRGATTTFQRREVARDGRNERIIRIGYTTDGRRFRTREFYSI